MTPGDYKARGEGIVVRWSFHPSPFGLALIFVDRPRPRRPRLRRSRRGGGGARRHAGALAAGDLCRGPRGDGRLCGARLRPAAWSPDRPLRVVMIGSDFEIRVWETLLKLPLRQGDDLFGHRRPYRQAGSGAGGRRRRRQEPGLLRRPLPPGARQERRPLRLSLGSDAQARHPRLGSRRHRRRVRAAGRLSVRPQGLMSLATSLIRRNIWSGSTGEGSKSKCS